MLIPLIPFEKWATLKFLHDDDNYDNDKDDDQAITIDQHFLQNRNAKNQFSALCHMCGEQILIDIIF